MTVRAVVAPCLLAAAVAVFPDAARAQSFHVAKYDIGGDGGTDYLTAEPGTGRVFVSRGTHVMVVDGKTGKVLGDIPDTPRMHGVGLAPKHNRGFTRFHRRGRSAVRTEWRLMATTHNLRKLHRHFNDTD